MKTVFGWSDGGSGCEYYRLRVPLEHLTMRGHVDARYGGHFQLPKPDVLPDVVIGQRTSRPEPAHFWTLMAKGHLGERPRMIYEIDDDLFHVEPSNPVYGHFSQRSVQNTIRHCMTLADAITVSTEPLAAEVKRQLAQHNYRCPPVHVIPNALPLMAYRHEERPLGFGTKTVGWAGSSTHEHDFYQVAGSLCRFLRKRSRWKFLAIGSMFESVARNAPPRQLEKVGWIRDMVDYYAALDRFDVGLIPIEDNAFNRSKSDLKFLEYAARRVPVIASDCGPYAEHVAAGLAVGAGDWYQALAQSSARIRTDITTDQAFEYAYQRRVDNVEKRWLGVIDGG